MQLPYSDIKRDTQVVLAIHSGKRPTKPQRHFEERGLSSHSGTLWSLLQSCWHRNPKHRPWAVNLQYTLEIMNSIEKRLRTLVEHGRQVEWFGRPLNYHEVGIKLYSGLVEELHRIAHGGYRAVYLALLSSGSRVALKTIIRRSAQDKEEEVCLVLKSMLDTPLITI